MDNEEFEDALYDTWELISGWDEETISSFCSHILEIVKQRNIGKTH